MSNLFNIESENYVIGGMLDERNDTSEVYSRLSGSDIYSQENRRVFEAMKAGFHAGTGTDIATISEVLDRKYGDDMFGWMMDLSKNSTSIKNIDSHISRILSGANARKMEQTLIKLLTDVQSGSDNQESLQAMQGEIAELRTDVGYGVTHYKSMAETWAELMNELDERMDPDTPGGLTTGIEQLDEILGARGFQPKDMVIIGARPAGGKTMAAGKVALHIALSLHKPALVFSMEMGRTSLMQRFISQGARVSPDVFYDGEKLSDMGGHINNAVIPLNKSKLHIDDRSSLTFSELASSARQFKEAYPDVAFIVVDYIMLMKVDSVGKRQDQAYGDVSLALLALGKELNVTMVVLSQCSKACESRTDKRPIASDLKEISQLEADATHVIMMYNESAYNEDTAMGQVVELIVRKNRFGSKGTAYQEIKGGWMEGIQKDELCRRQDRCEMQGKKDKLKSGWDGDD